MNELDKKFDFKTNDDKWAKYWEDNNTFHAKPDKNKRPFTIVIPPPNITGILHMGHALNNTLQDIIIRYKRMKGFEALWMPGTDHAGIATQNVVERKLAKENKTRHDVGREDFLEYLWDWKKEYGDTIIHQLKKLGSSCDWQRTRFTMDEGYSEAVRKVFVDLYNKKLIYKGSYIINWCPRCLTALSDEEAEHRDTLGSLYHIRYPFKDNPDEYLIVATTRPETMLGDSAVAVNPSDERYKDLIGREILLPIVKRSIKVIADSFVAPEFGTGAVKVTPAHDPNDFDMGKRHNLEFINIMHPDARLNEQTCEFEGMDRFEAREALVELLIEMKLLVKVEPHQHAVGHCYRCHTVVEPYLSKQWFVKMKPMAEKAIEVVKNNTITFYPDRWTKVYLNWMENIRDWCISRQIWWGHRIPVWYCAADGQSDIKCKEPIVSVTVPEKCPHCGSIHLIQDEDVLDTWFSSWLWPFATLDWPKENEDLKYFYPTATLFTASEIIFFWVARMIMSGCEFMNEVPFKEVYIHGTVRDANGLKMSKSLGNAIDPLEIIEEYGADALRFSLIINSGQDLYISKDKFEIGRNFANKIWNATRLILMNIGDIQELSIENISLNNSQLDLPSKWILARFNITLKKVEEAVEAYRYSEAESLIYEFFWNNFCDWYLEIIKNKWGQKEVQRAVGYILVNSLKMMSPFIPFVTEDIWSHIYPDQKCLSIQSWPVYDEKLIDESALNNMQIIIDTVTNIRNIRAEWGIALNQDMDCHLNSANKELLNMIIDNQDILIRLTKIKPPNTVQKDGLNKKSATALVGDINIIIPLGELIDIEKEKSKKQQEIDKLKKIKDGLSKRLNNESFLQKAPKEVVDKEKENLVFLNNRILDLEKIIKSLN